MALELEVVVVRKLLRIRLKTTEVRHVGRDFAILVTHLRLGHPIVGVILCSWGVWIADGGANLRDVVAITCEKIGSQNRTGRICQK